jgi:beta-lactamase regulating signal transducer with metallopeptidase domain
MIAAWMVYSILVACLVVAAANAAEFIARATGSPTRVVWGAAFAIALGLSGQALIGSSRADGTESSRSVTPANAATRSVATSVASIARQSTEHVTRVPIQQRVADETHGAITRFERLMTAITAPAADRWNRPLIVAWLVSSSFALFYLAVSYIRLRRLERGFMGQMLDGHRVLVSEDIGPALFGFLRPRVVVPHWVLALSASERQTIVAHEREHATALDPVFLLAAAIVLAFEPWNVALWVLFRRLRFALEADCDRRVLGAKGDRQAYGRLLMAVCQRAAPGPVSHVAFVERQSNLERRIRRIVWRPRWLSFAGAVATVSAIVMLAAAWTTPVPIRRLPTVSASRHPEMNWRISALPSIRPDTPFTSTGVFQIAGPRVDATPALDVPDRSVPVGTEIVATARAARVSEPCAIIGLYFDLRVGLKSDARGPDSTDSTAYPVVVARSHQDCVIDADFVVLGLDSSHVFLAMGFGDPGSTSVIGGFVFTTAPNPNLVGMQRSMTQGHAVFHNGDFYVADSGEPALVFGASAARLKERYPNAFQLQSTGVSLNMPHVYSFDWIRDWSARCAVELKSRAGVQNSDRSHVRRPPSDSLIAADGRTVTEKPRDCLAWLDK